MFLGLGCPKQDHFAAEHAEKIDAVQLCIGTALTFWPTLNRWLPTGCSTAGWPGRFACIKNRSGCGSGIS